MAGYEKIAELLQKEFALAIHPIGAKDAKTEIINPSANEFSYLSIKFNGKDVYPGRETVGRLKTLVKQEIKKGQLNAQLFTSIYQTIEKWIAIYSYLDIERYFNEIDAFVKAELTKQFGNKKYHPKKCKNLAKKRRAKQYQSSTKSFWRNPDLASLLPKFIRYRLGKKKTAA
jgi:RNA-directed DNA polymerase